MHGNISYKKPHISMLKNQELKLLVTQLIRTQNSWLINKAFQASPNIKAIIIQADRILAITTEVLMLHDLLAP